MSDTRFTKGLWRWAWNRLVVVDNPEDTVIMTPAYFQPNKADMELIAAAPEMYGLLEMLEDAFISSPASGATERCAYDVVIRWRGLRARINGGSDD